MLRGNAEAEHVLDGIADKCCCCIESSCRTDQLEQSHVVNHVIGPLRKQFKYVD